MTDWKALAAAEADQLLEAALQHPLSIKTRPSKTGLLANATPRALGLNGDWLLQQLPPQRHFLGKITADNGFLNFHFSFVWYTNLLEDCPAPAPRWVWQAPPSQDCPATLDPWDVKLLTAQKGTVPHWQLAARQDRANPAWLVRYTVARLKAMKGRGPVGQPLTQQERALLRLCGDYAALRQQPKKLAHWLTTLSRQVWDAEPRSLSEPVRQCVCHMLQAGMAAFTP